MLFQKAKDRFLLDLKLFDEHKGVEAHTMVTDREVAVAMLAATLFGDEELSDIVQEALYKSYFVANPKIISEDGITLMKCNECGEIHVMTKEAVMERWGVMPKPTPKKNPAKPVTKPAAKPVEPAPTVPKVTA